MAGNQVEGEMKMTLGSLFDGSGGFPLAGALRHPPGLGGVAEELRIKSKEELNDAKVH